jgi:hypothetical protein
VLLLREFVGRQGIRHTVECCCCLLGYSLWELVVACTRARDASGAPRPQSPLHLCRSSSTES